LKKVDIKGRIILRMYLMLAVITLFAGGVVVKAVSIQTYKGGYWKQVADSLTTSLRVLPAERGNIYSADDRLLATSMPYFKLHLDLGSSAMSDEIFDQHVDSLAIMMAFTFKEKSAQAYRQSLISARKKKRRYFPFCKRADYSLLKEIRQWPLIREGKYKGGLIVETLQERKNPYGQLASRTIGMWRENAPNIGLEASYKEYLEGREGRRLMQRIAGSTWVPLTSENAIEPQNGKDIITTIDVNLQDVAQSSLLDAMMKHDAESGCVIVMEVKTGAIRAIANLGREPNGTFSEKYNYAVANSTEPGSTFKVASYLAMLDEGVLKPDDTVSINHGTGVFANNKMVDAGGWNRFDLITAEQSFARSSNVGVAKLVIKSFGKDRKAFYNKIEKFGLTKKSGIDLIGEPDPVFSKAETWSATSLPWRSIGYEIKFTPLQLLTFYNAIANGGKRMQPYLVQQIVDNGKVIKEFKPVQLSGPIASTRALADITSMMRAVVENDSMGTAKKILTPHYAIAGKTGTAKLYDPAKGFVNKYQASFGGFFPADDPKYSCFVVIIGPSGLQQHGGDVAAPVFRELADKIMSVDVDMHSQANLLARSEKGYLPPVILGELNDVASICKKFGYNVRINNKESDYLFARMDSNVVKVKEIPASGNKVPDVRGLAADDAIYILENAGLKVLLAGAGKVRTQSIPAGAAIIKGSVIQIILG
jgi:cell division protein FtsI (penicillin-binding protein 3)